MSRQMDQRRTFISICIPAYKRVDFLKRLLDSIASQTFQDFEVIVSDDSPGVEVSQLLEAYKSIIPQLSYHRNLQALGTPENWNEAMRKATGQWIKIMHDDDWFNGVNALEKFAEAASDKTKALLFCSYIDVFLASGKERRVRPAGFRFRQLQREPVSLLSRNIIGPPSVVMHINDGYHFYDPKLKWLVDVDMYVRRLKDEQLIYIPDALVMVGVGQDQVTASVHGDPGVEVPEHFYFLEKSGIRRLRNILVYDYWWRFIRNFSLRKPADVFKYTAQIPIHPVMQSMMAWQAKIPLSWLKRGFFSKPLMLLHYCLHRNKLKQ